MNAPFKTSETHPLEIHAVATPGGGAIGLCMAPGKYHDPSITGPWDRDLDVDFDAIEAFGATQVITLMEADELDGVKIPVRRMRAVCVRRAIHWRHWPIVDFQTPDAAFEELWIQGAGDVCETLAEGGRVIVHCRGGRGRSGLVAARLLIEMGLSNEEAFAAVRAAQPLAMETPVQEDHVRGFKPVLGLKG